MANQNHVTLAEIGAKASEACSRKALASAGLDLAEADVTGADLCRAKLSYANLSGVQLWEISLSKDASDFGHEDQETA